jgi:predicted aldo/keto reductase-like oxidoreductase
MSEQQHETNITRRDFLRHSAETLAVTALGAEIAKAAPAPALKASDWVQLGRLNKQQIKIPRLGMGTGSVNGKVQQELGQAGLNKLVKYAFERGVRYIDTAKNYSNGAMHLMLRETLRAERLPREKLFIQTKMPSWKGVPVDTLAVIDSYRMELGVDYLDSLLIHCTTTPDWPEKLKRMRDAFDEAQARGWIRTKGMSCHGLAALREAAKHDWMEVQLARVNPQGRFVDSDHPTNPHHPEGKVAEAMKEIKAMHDKGRGIIGMKLIGEGAFTDPAEREKAIQYAMTCGFVDAVVIGFKNNAEIDEAVERINRALKA